MPDLTETTENIHTDTPENVETETAPEGLAESAGKETGAPDAYDFQGVVPEGEVFDEEIASGFGNLCKEMNLTCLLYTSKQSMPNLQQTKHWRGLTA